MSLPENLLLLEQHFIFFKTPYIQRKGKGGRQEQKRTMPCFLSHQHWRWEHPLLLQGRITGAASLETCSYNTPLGNNSRPPSSDRKGLDWRVGNWQPSRWSSCICLKEHLGCEAIIFCSTHCYTPPGLLSI